MVGPPGSDPIQALWIGERLSNLEQLSLASFVANGHTVHLYTYEDVACVPEGVEVIDGRTILPEDSIFAYGPNAVFGVGSYAAFANLFRYKLLMEKGGWWIDMDMVCLRPFDMEAPYVFGHEYSGTINCAVMRLPKGSAVAQALYQEAQAKGHGVKFGETGPDLFTAKIVEFQLEEYALPSDAFYPVGAWAAAAFFEEDRDGARMALLKDAYGVHFWNEMLRWSGQDKDATFPPTCIYEQLKARYCVGLEAG